ncbi:ROK family transcriptional regulator [Fodinicola feengrottensis]|uniref:ROK family transcriptional regulator n=2 Tax=Fodinicola feengrottensis TaxID=435914 RepID=A0ABN2HL66_9ACTN
MGALMAEPDGQPLLAEQLDTLVTVLDLARSGTARTRPEIIRHSGLGRTVVTQRVAHLIDAGLLEEGTLGPSNGGRAPRQLHFRANAGHLLVAELGATSISVGIADLAGQLVAQQEEPWTIASGAEATLTEVERMFDTMLDTRNPNDPQIWGIGVGVPGPVEFATGRPVAPPIMPGWDGYQVRDRLAERYDVPVWVDNEVNLMALGEFRGGLARGERDLVYLKIGTGIGAGLISAGQLHRGNKGCAGDVGHVAILDDASVICRCGNIGCLEAFAGGAALARDGLAAATDGRSPYLARLLTKGHSIEARDVAKAATHGDLASVELLTRSGRLVGEMLATLVNFFNPSLVLVGGGVAGAGDLLLATIKQTVYRRSLPLATRDLRIARSPLDDRAGLMGAAFMVIDELMSRERLTAWIGHKSPIGRSDVVHPVPVQ